MTTQRKLEVFLLVAVLLLGTLFLRGWVLSDREMRRAQAETADANTVVHSATIAIQQRDAAAASKDQQLAAQAAALKTPQQAAQVILRYLPAPASGQPAAVAPPTVDRAELSPELQKSLPDAPTFTMLTPTQVQDIARHDLECAATTNDLTACKADTTDLHAEVAARTTEADTWKAAAKGGTRFQRFVRVLKFTACAGAGAGVGALADKHSPATGAAIGGAAGVGGCSLF